MGAGTPEQELYRSKHKTDLLLDKLRRKKQMADTMTGSEYSDFNPDEVDQSIKESHIMEPDPIMDATTPKKVKPMQEESFPKFQYSIFVDAQRNAQMVIRANSIEEFVKAKKDVDQFLTFTVSSANPVAQATVPAAQPAPVTQANPNAPICGVHGTPMQWKTGISGPQSKTPGKPYAMWSCGLRNQDGSYCRFKPQQ